MVGHGVTESFVSQEVSWFLLDAAGNPKLALAWSGVPGFRSRESRAKAQGPWTGSMLSTSSQKVAWLLDA